ncbi:MAG: hypothetical protein RBT46_09430 [Weeksellaceae bacterium]|jgi:hypothetical protein|nr:hypothetical protein [Weeksellaceae bacterium]
MSKQILFSILLILGLGFTNAQKTEISISYGVPSLYGVAYDFVNVVFNQVDQNEEVRASAKGVLDASISFYSPNQKWQYGLDLMNEFFDDDNTGYGTDANFLTLLPNVNYLWRKPERKFQVYSGAGFGITFMKLNYTDKVSNGKVNDSKTVLTWNVTPFGLKYGHDYGLFFDSSVGIRSFARLGFFYRF